MKDNEEFFEYGTQIQSATIDSLNLIAAKKTFRVCLQYPDVTIIELREIKTENEPLQEIIIIDCISDQIPTKNDVGIKYKERLALVFFENSSQCPMVRALRKSFPDTPHQNLVPDDEPKSMCIYDNIWHEIKHTWTPQKFITRILWWLQNTAIGSTHQEDQPVENFYFDSIFKIIIPPYFFEKVKNEALSFFLTQISRFENTVTLKVEHFQEDQPVDSEKYNGIALEISPVVHGEIKKWPLTLGKLHDQFERKGNSIIEILRDKLKEIVQDVDKNKINFENKIFLIIQIPIKRQAQGEVERYEFRGFCIQLKFSELGKLLEVFEIQNGRPGLIIGPLSSIEWREIKIIPVDIIKNYSRELAHQIAGITNQESEFSGLLIGVGALGSNLVNIWNRIAWGHWTLLDTDYVLPHNLARHLAFENFVGLSKAEAVKYLLEYTYPKGYLDIKGLTTNFYGKNNKELQEVIASSELIVDASTTLAIPRSLATREISRAVSVFLIPSGEGAVLLFEDKDRNIRLDVLEAQYYRAVISNDWGEGHVKSVKKPIRYGMGCRDISVNIDIEFVQIFSGVLARHVRNHKNHPVAKIQIWHINSKTSNLSSDEIVVKSPIFVEKNKWKVIWDTFLKDKLRQLRQKNLPYETGGILLGYFDQELKTIYIVDALPQPLDSESGEAEFIRGTDGLPFKVKNVEERTGGVVSYVGEWHSHPNGVSPNLSDLDFKLLGYLYNKMKQAGEPAVILVVSENEENWDVRYDDE